MMGRSKKKSNYGFLAKIYDPIFYLALKPVRIAVMNELLKFKDKIIFDLCCGTGNQIKLLSKHGFKNLYCLDISDSMLEIAKRGDSSIKIYKGDAIKTNFDNALFDIVMLSFAIHEKDRNTQPFLKGFFDESKKKQPGMMTLIALATSVAYFYSSAVVFGLKGKFFSGSLLP